MHIFLVNLDPGKTPSIFSWENLLESSSNLFIFQVQEKYICRQNKTAKDNLSLQPKSPWKSCPLWLDFCAHLKLKICTVRIWLYGLYEFPFHCTTIQSKTSLERHVAHSIQCCSYCTFCYLLCLDFHAQLCLEITPSVHCNNFLLQNFSPALSLLSPFCSWRKNAISLFFSPFCFPKWLLGNPKI